MNYSLYPNVLLNNDNATQNIENKNNKYNIYKAVCEEEKNKLDNQFKLPNVNKLSPLNCPLMKQEDLAPYISKVESSPFNEEDKKWWYMTELNNNNCLPKFSNTINVCDPSICINKDNKSEYLKYYNCNKVFNNHTKRKFLNLR